MSINLEEIEFMPLGEVDKPADPPVNPEDTDTDTNTDNTDVELGDETDDDNQVQDTDTNDDKDDKDDTDEEDKPESLYKGLIDSVGLNLQQEELDELLAIEETDEGFKTVATIVAEKLAQQKLDSILERHPHTKNLFKFESNGGNPDEFFDIFFPEVDYSQVQISEEDTEIQKDVIAESLASQGFSEDEIKETIEDYENGGLLYKQASRSLKLLQSQQEQKKADFAKRQEDLEKQRNDAIEAEMAKVNEIITQKDIKGIKIPESKIEAFKEYLYKPVTEDGLSKALVDSQKMDLENRLLIAYLQMNNFDLASLVKIQANNSVTRNLRDSLKNKDKLKDKEATSKDSKYDKNPDVSKIELF